MTVRDIIRKYLENNDFNGLESSKCACTLDDLLPADCCPLEECVAGHLDLPWFDSKETKERGDRMNVRDIVWNCLDLEVKREIVKKYLKDHDYDGLACIGGGCGCGVERLFCLCLGSYDSKDCEAVYRGFRAGENDSKHEREVR